MLWRKESYDIIMESGEEFEKDRTGKESFGKMNNELMGMN